MSKKKELLVRAYFVLVILVLVALALISATMKIAVIESRAWQEKGDSTKLMFVDIEPERGNILSTDGRMLATSVPYFDLHMDLNSEAMTDYLFDKHLDSLSIYLSWHVFKNETPADVKRRLIRGRKAGDRYFLIKKKATFDELTRIRNFPLIKVGKYAGGLIIERKSSRLKPFKNLASRTIGLDREHGQVGLEGQYDSYLRGEVGKRLMQRVSSGVWVPVHDLSEIQPERGEDVVTTLDMRMQDISEDELKQVLSKHDADYGLAIVMEVETGAIRAMVNLDEVPGGNYQEVFNHAIADLNEPGSTFKLASVMALLEDGFIDIYDTVDINHGRARFGRFNMQDAHWRPETRASIKHAFEISSNVGIARIVDDYYGVADNAQKFLKRLRQFGLHEKTNIDLEGEGLPRIKDVDHPTWNRQMTLPWMAHGYELALTPIQTLTFYNAVANGGRKMKPYLVDRIAKGGKSIKTFEPEVLVKNIASQETIEVAKLLLEGVVQNGTGSTLKSSHYTFAGKSGTTKLEYWKGEESKYLSSFVGYFPAEKPRYSCIVMVNNPKKEGYYGATVAGTVFKAIADRCMATDPGLMAFQSAPDTGIMVTMPLFQAGYTADVRFVAESISLPFLNDATSDWAIMMPGDEQPAHLQNRFIQSGTVPNVVGMGLRDAIFILENHGLSVKINGAGRVVDQSVKPGAEAKGQRILLYLG